VALDPLELIVIGVVLVVIFLWGPQKIPEIAKAIGRARREFDQASKELSGTLASTGTLLAESPTKSGDELLIETARKLGISTTGKTREQISDEIVKKSSN
jgi:sec-independent protein translocase protein TatA